MNQEQINSGENKSSNSVASVHSLQASSNQIPNWFWALLCLPILMTYLIYQKAIDFDFVNWDDPLYIQYNPYIREFSLSSIIWLLTHYYAGFWTPLTMISLSFDYLIGGLNPQVYHFHNIALHCINTALVYILSYRILTLAEDKSSNGRIIERPITKLFSAFMVAILFGLHPIHVESVAWATERKDLLYGLFFLASIITYISYNAQSPRRSWKYYLCLLFFFLSTASKPMSVTLPFVLILLDYWPLRRIHTHLKYVFVEKMPFFAIVVLSSALAVISQYQAGTLAGFGNLSLSFRIMNAFHSIIFYLWKMILPFGLTTLYPVVYSRTYSVEYIGSAILVAAICYFVYKSRNKYPSLLTAWLYYMITLAPVLGIIQVGHQSAADRFTYLPSLGPFLIIAVFMIRVFHKRQSILFVALSVIMFFLGYRTNKQVNVWQNSITLWENTLKTIPRNSTVAYTNLADAYKTGGRLMDALREFERAILIGPPTTYPHDGRGEILLSNGMVDDSIREFVAAISIDPNNNSPYCHLALAYKQKGLYTDALNSVKKAIQIDPYYSEAHNILGVIYNDLGRYNDSIKSFQRAMSLEPYHYNPTYLRNLVETCNKSVLVNKCGKRRNYLRNIHQQLE